ncbi:hypothetical protein ACA910_011227 [Epithemia clementina (nom. ined.)]
MFLMLLVFIPDLTLTVAVAQCTVWDKNGNALKLDGPLPKGIIYDGRSGKLTCHGDYSCSGFTIASCLDVICNGKHSCEKAHLPNNRQVTCAADYACHLVLAMNGHDFKCGENGAKQSCKHAAFQTDAHVYCVYNGACDQDSWEDRLHVSVGLTGKVYCLTTPTTTEHNNKAITGRQLPCRNILVEIPTAHRACFSRQDSSPSELNRCGVYCHPDFETSCDVQEVKFLHQQVPPRPIP